MANIQPIYLDSNFCRNPHVVKQWGPYEGLALDLLVFIAARTHQPRFKTAPVSMSEAPVIYFLASHFVSLFGHSRQLLHQPLGPAADAIMKDYPPSVRKQVVTPIDFVLFMMDARNVIFGMSTRSKAYYRMVGPDRKVIHETDKISVIGHMATSRAQGDRVAGQPISYEMKVLPAFVANNHYQGQGFQLEKYLNICTEGGEENVERKLNPSGSPRKPSRPRTWPAGRRLLLRLIWRWGMWQSAGQVGTNIQTENFEEMCEVAGLFNPNVKTRASKLRQMLARVCELAELPFSAEVILARPTFANLQMMGGRAQSASCYEIKLTRTEGAAPAKPGNYRKTRPKSAPDGRQTGLFGSV